MEYLLEGFQAIGQNPKMIAMWIIGGILIYLAIKKVMNLFCKEKINPLIGAAGISAFPMAARVVEKVGVKEDSSNHLLMHAVGANVSGQIASAIVGGLIIGLVL